MNTLDPLQIYIDALLEERKAYLRQAALKRVRGELRGMDPKEKETFLQSKAFTALLFRMERSDRIAQTLRRGELAPPYQEAEYSQLRGLIQREAENGRDVDLVFLRSVVQSRVNLQRAHLAVRRIEQLEVRKLLDGRIRPLVSEACRKAEEYLKNGSFTCEISAIRMPEDVLSSIVKDKFSCGITPELLEQAYHPSSLTSALQNEIWRSFPELRACGAVRTKGGRPISNAVQDEIRRAKDILSAKVRKRFPEERIRHLLSVNQSVRKLQKRYDAVHAKEKKLRTALLKAVPEHYRDLYPLARQMHREFVLHMGPTNSGKTHEATGRLRGAMHGIYLGPLRLLAAEQFETMNLNDVPCSLVTGEEQILVNGSRVQASTVEMADLREHYDVAVIDECQMIADRERGGAWTSAILGLCADEIHLCASPDAEGLLTRIITDLGDSLRVVRHERMTPLVVEKEGFHFPDSVRPGDALIVFSKARVHAVAAELRRIGHRVSLVYGALPPDVRRDQALRFRQGETDIVVSTDAIAMGMNLPIERVVFLEMEKYDGDITRPLLDAEIKQIAGRAGRYGKYEIGYVNAYGFKSVVAQALSKSLLPLNEAIINFPESLLGLPLPLTEIIKQWLLMQDKGCFSKASASRMEALAAMMETKNTDKALLYRFLCIPFDETEPDLLARWRAMYHAECSRQHISVLQEIPGLLNPDECTVEMLDSLEADYRCCDLYYNYARLFIEEPLEILEAIQRRKDLISQGIIHILSTQKLQQRLCPSCRRQLPWNWPYRLCDLCHDRQRGYGGEGGHGPRRKRRH
ncbi:MAG: helicase [Clostridia bacterium]|nr:helicase [Clostridia bacterium]